MLELSRSLLMCPLEIAGQHAWIPFSSPSSLVRVPNLLGLHGVGVDGVTGLVEQRSWVLTLLFSSASFDDLLGAILCDLTAEGVIMAYLLVPDEIIDLKYFWVILATHLHLAVIDCVPLHLHIQFCHARRSAIQVQIWHFRPSYLWVAGDGRRQIILVDGHFLIKYLICVVLERFWYVSPVAPWVCALDVQAIQGRWHWRLALLRFREIYVGVLIASAQRLTDSWGTAWAVVLLYNDVGIWIFELILQSHSSRFAARSFPRLRVRRRCTLHHVPTCVEHLELASIVVAELIALLTSRIGLASVRGARRAPVLHGAEGTLAREQLVLGVSVARHVRSVVQFALVRSCARCHLWSRRGQCELIAGHIGVLDGLWWPLLGWWGGTGCKLVHLSTVDSGYSPYLTVVPLLGIATNCYDLLITCLFSLVLLISLLHFSLIIILSGGVPASVHAHFQPLTLPILILGTCFCANVATIRRTSSHHCSLNLLGVVATVH